MFRVVFHHAAFFLPADSAQHARERFAWMIASYGPILAVTPWSTVPATGDGQMLLDW